MTAPAPEDLLFAPREAIEAAQARNFARQIEWALTRHPHYREMARSLGLTRTDFGSIHDLARLPLTGKDVYMRDPDRFRLATDGLPEEMRTVWDTMYTTGSTAGQPTPFVSTTFDFFQLLQLQRNMLRLRGARATDTIVNLFPLTRAPHGGWTRALHGAASMSIPVVAAMPGRPSETFTVGNDTDGVVRVVERSRGTILWGVPSYIAHLVTRAQELGADFGTVRLVFVTGEGLGEPARAELISALARVGATAAVHVSYGATEIQGGFVECAPGSGYHNPAPDQIHVDIVDPNTSSPLPDGDSGLVVISHLSRTGTVLLRYALGDISVRSRERCPHCGSWTDRFTATPRRVDALVKIKGMLVNPAVLVETIEYRVAGRTFQASVEKRGTGEIATDALVVRVADQADRAAESRLIEAIRAAVGVTPEVQYVAAGALVDPGEAWKMKKFIDRR